MTASTPARLTYPVETPPAAGTTHELAPGVHWLRMPLPFPPEHINLWLLADGESWVVVDTGLCRDDGKAHWENIFATTLQGRPVTRVIVTISTPTIWAWRHGSARAGTASCG